MITLQGITKVYDAGGEKISALEGVDLNVAKGEFVAIMGPSGSGKSTLLHILGLLDSSTGGEYKLENRPVQGLSDKDKARLRNQHFGFIFQSFYLLPEYSALENVMLPLSLAGMPLKERRQKAGELLVKVGLSHRVNFFPSMLSGGQQQRVAIARALANDPTVIFADEPTGNLPLAMGEEILDILTDLNKQGVSIVMVTHDDRLAERATRVVHVQDGKVLSQQAITKGPHHAK
jgi:putative ABC transport system ATP-binding protein